MNAKEFGAAAYLKHADFNDAASNNNEETQTNKPKTIRPAAFPKLTRQENPVQPKKMEFKPFEPQKLTKKTVETAENQKSEQSSEKKQTFAPSESFNNFKNVNARLNDATEFLKTGGLVKVPVEPAPEGQKESVYRRVAKFLVLIGENEAAKILPHLSETQIEKIIPEIASIRSIDEDEAQQILTEFNGLMDKAREQGGVDTAREMLEKAYGKDKAEKMIKKAIPLEGKIPFVYLNDADSERIYQLLHDESSGIQSMVLSYLEPKKAASVINLMKPEEKKDVVLRLAKMEPVSPDVIERVDKAMHEKSLKQTVEKSENIDGKNALAQILKKMDYNSEKDILSYLSQDNPDLGQDLRNRLFTMDDVLKSDDRFIQQKLQLMSEVDIAYLIAGKPDEFRSKILNNISSGRRTEALAQEDILKPMRKSDCERITSEFFSQLRRGFEEGHLIIKDRNDDTFV